MATVMLISQINVILKFTSMTYIMSKTHVLNNLIILEYAAAVIVIYSFKTIATLNMEFYLILFIMILLITESVVGLSLLINIIRTHSNDYLKTTSLVLF